MLDICLDEASLLFGSWVSLMATGVRADGIVVVVRPLSKVIGKFQAGYVGGGIFKVNDDQLLVLVGCLEQGGLFIIWLDT